MKRNLYYLILTYFFIYNISIQLYSQDKVLRFEHITVENGLSENAVSCIHQDKQGFLWFGTHDGLNRYDGYNFKIFRNDPKNPLTISSNLIRTIFEDSNGNLWIGTFNGGLNKFDPDKNIFKQYMADPKKKNGISFNNIRTIYEDKNKILWIGTEKNGLNRFDRNTQKFFHYFNDPKNPSSISSNFITKIFEDSSGTLWIATTNGLNSFDRGNSIFNHYYYKKNNVNIKLHIGDILEDKPGFLWISSEKGLMRFSIKDKSFINFQKNPSIHSTIFEEHTSTIFLDKDGLIWISKWGKGFYIFNPKTGVVNHYSNNPGKDESLSHDRVTQIFSDRSDIIWIATEGGGLNKFDKKKTVFENYYHDPLNKNSLSQNNIKRIYEDKEGILWIGTDGKGLNRVDRRKNKFKLFINDPNNPASISSNYIRSIFEDKFGFLWIGTLNGGLNKYNKKTGNFFRYNFNPNDKYSIPSDTVSHIIEDNKGILWFALESGVAGLCRYDRGKNIFIRYSNDPENPKSISNMSLIDIFEDKDKIIWCGGGDGLNRFNRKDESFTNYTLEPDNNASLSHNWVWSIFEDIKGRLWIGTYGGGLNLFNKKKNSFIHYTKKDGLANNVVYGILDDKEGNLWISTNNGLSKLDIETNKFKNFDKRDGLQGNEFNTGSYCKGKDGRLYFGGTNGLTAFYPENVKDYTNIPSIVITSFKVFNKEFKLPQQITKTKKILLKYDQNFISFEFASLDYSIPGKNKYAYKLEGVNQNWIYEDAKRRFANFTSLSPGSYIFKVKGTNSDGIWNTKGISLRIKILPPIWKTWWFTIIWVVLIIFVFIIITNFIYRYILLLKEKAQAERFASIGKYASFLAHDIKSPLEGTYLILNELKKLLPGNDEKQEYIDDAIVGISQIRSIIKGSLDFSKVNNPKLEKFDLNQIIAEFCYEFKKIKTCTFNLKLNKSILMVYLDHSLIRRVFLNLFQNSFHAQKENCEITIRTEIKKNYALIYVSDKGKGISKKIISSIFEPFSTSKEDGLGIGLAFVSEVIKNHNGSIRVESKFGKETTFIISLPVVKNRRING